MAVSFVSSASNKSTTTSVVITAPASIQDGDILVAFVSVFRGTSSTATSITGTGWTQWAEQITSTRYKCSIFWKRAASESGNYTFNSASATQMQGAIGVYRGCVATGDPRDVLSNTAYVTSGTIVRAASCTPTVANGMFVYGGWYYLAGTISLGSPTGMNARETQANTNCAIRLSDLAYTTTAASGTKDATAGAACTVKHAFMVALKPLVVVAPTVTTQAVTNITTTTATCNVTITDTGGANATERGVCFMTGQSGDPTTANNKSYETGSYGVGAFQKSLIGGTPGVYLRVRGYAINSAGTSYGTTVQMQFLNASLTEGNVTIKMSGGDYSSWAEFWNDIGSLTGDVNCCVDASAFTENTAPVTCTANLNGYTVRVYPATFPTTTDGTTGARFSCNYTGYFLRLNNGNAGTILVEGILVLEGTAKPTYIIRIDSAVAETVKIRRCIFKGGQTSILTASTTPTYMIYNNIIYDQTGTANGMYITQNLNGFISNNTYVDQKGTNSWDGIAFNANSKIFTADNNLAYGQQGVAFNFVSAATGSNNSSADDSADDFGTGVNNRISKTTSPFTNYATDDFTLAAGSDPVGNGKNLSAYFTDDFFGNTRTAWDIGACAYAGAAITYLLKYHTGTVFAQKPLKYYTGSTWAAKPLKVYTGTEWILVN